MSKIVIGLNEIVNLMGENKLKHGTIINMYWEQGDIPSFDVYPPKTLIIKNGFIVEKEVNRPLGISYETVKARYEVFSDYRIVKDADSAIMYLHEGRPLYQFKDGKMEQTTNVNIPTMVSLNQAYYIKVDEQK